MKVLFIYPTMITEVPMTIAGLSALAKKEGWETDAIINTFKKPLSVNEIIFETIKRKPDVVAISMITFDVLFTYELIRKLRKNKFYVAVGGPHPTDCPEEVLEAGANVVVVGEGEHQFKDILKNFPKEKGIMDRREPVDLSKLPLPDLEVFDKELFKGEDGLIKGFHRLYTSRGCPGRCTFCDWQVFKQNLRYFPMEKIFEDIKRRREKYGIDNFNIADDCFTINHDKVREFCKGAKELGITWRASSRANLVTPELLKEMKDSGCYSIAFGLESGDPETLLKAKKGVLLKHNENAPKIAHEAGLEVYGCLMTGFPWETPKNLQNQIDFIHKCWDYVSLYQVSGSLMPFPGTEIYREFNEQYGFTKYWLKPEMQEYGIQVYQNALNPFSVSTYYHRYLFDDTYIRKELFFKYSKEYKDKVREMVWEIGRHNVLFMFPNRPIKQKLVLLLSKLSMILYDINPDIEMRIGGFFFNLLGGKDKRASIEKLRDKRRGIVLKK